MTRTLAAALLLLVACGPIPDGAAGALESPFASPLDGGVAPVRDGGDDAASAARAIAPAPPAGELHGARASIAPAPPPAPVARPTEPVGTIEIAELLVERSGSSYVVRDGASPEDVCAAVARTVEMNLEEHTCEVDDASANAGGGARIALFWVSDTMDRLLYALWPRPEGGADVIHVATDGWGVNWDGRTEVVRVSRVPRHDGRIAVALRLTGSDSSCTEPLNWDVDERSTVVCDRRFGGAACTTRIPTRVHVVETKYEWDSDVERSRVSTSYALRLAHTATGVRLRRIRGRIEPAWRPMLGRRTLAELAERPIDPTWLEDEE